MKPTLMTLRGHGRIHKNLGDPWLSKNQLQLLREQISTKRQLREIMEHQKILCLFLLQVLDRSIEHYKQYIEIGYERSYLRISYSIST